LHVGLGLESVEQPVLEALQERPELTVESRHRTGTAFTLSEGHAPRRGPLFLVEPREVVHEPGEEVGLGDQDVDREADAEVFVKLLKTLPHRCGVLTAFDRASRQEIGSVVAAVPPILAGLAGKPVNVETLGGYLQYKYGTFFPLVVSLWSILALSGTLAAEARRGSLEFVAANAVTRRRIALEKLLGHVTSVVIAMAVIFVSIVIAGGAFAKLPGDAFGVDAAAGYAIWLGLLALAAGSVAFALAPLLGRGSAAGIAGAVTFGGFLLNGYQGAIPSLAAAWLRLRDARSATSEATGFRRHVCLVICPNGRTWYCDAPCEAAVIPRQRFMVRPRR